MSDLTIVKNVVEDNFQKYGPPEDYSPEEQDELLHWPNLTDGSIISLVLDFSEKLGSKKPDSIISKSVVIIGKSEECGDSHSVATTPEESKEESAAAENQKSGSSATSENCQSEIILFETSSDTEKATEEVEKNENLTSTDAENEININIDEKLPKELVEACDRLEQLAQNAVTIQQIRF